MMLLTDVVTAVLSRVLSKLSTSTRGWSFVMAEWFTESHVSEAALLTAFGHTVGVEPKRRLSK